MPRLLRLDKAAAREPLPLLLPPLMRRLLPGSHQNHRPQSRWLVLRPVAAVPIPPHPAQLGGAASCTT